jgi:hypothetical protein
MKSNRLPSAYAEDQPQTFTHVQGPGMLALFAVHIPLALLMFKMPALAKIHALSTFAVGMSLALLSVRIERVAYIGAYIIGAEVLWRMTGAGIFWEFGKYSVTAIFLISIFRNRFRFDLLSFLYFIMLIPSSLFLLSDLDFNALRNQMSFNLSGPLLLMVCVWFFKNIRLSKQQLVQLIFISVGPIVGILSIAVFSTITATKISFTTEANFITSGGFGPNQVSSVLGLGALLVFLSYIITERWTFISRILIFCLIVFLLTQSVLTFSRGGFYLFGISTTIALFHIINNQRMRFRAILLSLLIVITANYIIFPRLEAFTGGVVLSRFKEVKPASRGEILIADIEIWKTNLVMGVGPGAAKDKRIPYFRSAAAHIEFSRLLAEHGVFGVIALLLLLIISFRSFVRARTNREKAFVCSILIWVFLYLSVNAMRIAAPSLLFGLAFISLSGEGDDSGETLSEQEHTRWRIVW